jgi:hypothetical protein
MEELVLPLQVGCVLALVVFVSKGVPSFGAFGNARVGVIAASGIGILIIGSGFFIEAELRYLLHLTNWGSPGEALSELSWNLIGPILYWGIVPGIAGALAIAGARTFGRALLRSSIGIICGLIILDVLERNDSWQSTLFSLGCDALGGVAAAALLCCVWRSTIAARIAPGALAAIGLIIGLGWLFHSHPREFVTLKVEDWTDITFVVPEASAKELELRLRVRRVSPSYNGDVWVHWIPDTSAGIPGNLNLEIGSAKKEDIANPGASLTTLLDNARKVPETLPSLKLNEGWLRLAGMDMTPAEIECEAPEGKSANIIVMIKGGQRIWFSRRSARSQIGPLTPTPRWSQEDRGHATRFRVRTEKGEMWFRLIGASHITGLSSCMVQEGGCRLFFLDGRPHDQVRADVALVGEHGERQIAGPVPESLLWRLCPENSAQTFWIGPLIDSIVCEATPSMEDELKGWPPDLQVRDFYCRDGKGTVYAGATRWDLSGSQDVGIRGRRLKLNLDSLSSCRVEGVSSNVLLNGETVSRSRWSMISDPLKTLLTLISALGGALALIGVLKKVGRKKAPFEEQ